MLDQMHLPDPPDHVTYDLCAPAEAGKLIMAPGLWFTYAWPEAKFTGVHDGLWNEEGPALWVVDWVPDRDRWSIPRAVRLTKKLMIGKGLIRSGQPFLFWRNSGRYGWMTAR